MRPGRNFVAHQYNENKAAFLFLPLLNLKFSSSFRFSLIHSVHSKFTIKGVKASILFSRLVVRNGNSSLSTTIFDSDLDDIPEHGLLSEGSTLYLELTADSSSIPLLLALRYEGEPGDVARQSFPRQCTSYANCCLSRGCKFRKWRSCARRSF